MSVYITKSELRQLAKRGNKTAAFALSGEPEKKKRRTKAEWIEKFLQAPVAPTLTQAQAEKQRGLFEKHDIVVVKIMLPLPPQLNNYRAIFQPPRGRARLITSAAGRAYKEVVAKLWRDHNNGWTPEPLTGRLRVCIYCCMDNKRRADLDGRLKALLDSLTSDEETNNGVWLDDSQIDDLRILRGPVCPPAGYVDVTIEVIN